MINWDEIERETVLKLHLLRAAWEHSETADPHLHSLMRRDLYEPAIKHLARFCMAVQLEDADDPEG